MSYKKVSLLITFSFLLFVAAMAVGYVVSQNQRPDIIVIDEPFEEQVARLEEEKKQEALELENQPLSQGIEIKNKITLDSVRPMYDGHFYDLNGVKKTWDDYKGKFLLINFWATWCAPCVVELPTLDRLNEKFKDKPFEVIAISVDMNATPEKLNSFLKKRMIGDFAAYMDTDRALQRSVPMRGLPVTFFVDPNGNILHIYEGELNWSSPPMIDYFYNFLKDHEKNLSRKNK